MVDNTQQLFRFLQAVLPEEVPLDEPSAGMQTRDDFIQDVVEGIKAATMSVRMT
jgi:lysine 2,3-aminomutase